jgi:hypothetical protein
MDMIEILGSLLGQKAGGSGTGADILKDILTGGQRKAPPPRSSPPATPREQTAQEIDREARDLEDLLNVAKGRSDSRATRPPGQTPQPQAGQRQQPAGQGGPRQQTTASAGPIFPQDDVVQRQNEQATILVQAMVNAAKCDGQISQAEQQRILGQLENPSPEAIQFLREEFAKDCNVRDFAWSVPVGMEQQVYTMSLIAIDLDSDREQSYLRELARGLRLSPEVCEQIKSRLTGAGAQLAGAR